MVVVDVCAGEGGLPAGDPPESEEAEDVVNADAAGVSEDGAEHIAPGSVSGFGEFAGVPRGLGPVLPVLVVPVGGCAYRRLGGENACEVGGVGTSRVNTDGEVSHDSDAHACVVGGGAGSVELLVADPLEPAVEIDGGVVVAVFLGGAPACEVVESVAFVGEVVLVGRVAFGTAG